MKIAYVVVVAAADLRPFNAFRMATLGNLAPFVFEEAESTKVSLRPGMS